LGNRKRRKILFYFLGNDHLKNTSIGGKRDRFYEESGIEVERFWANRFGERKGETVRLREVNFFEKIVTM
jgi:very-short-patch-repair endonuclease